MPVSDVKRAYNALKGKQTAYDTLWAYYDGLQPLVYSTERLREAFKDLNAHFSLNWCAVVVDSTLDRLTLKQLTGGEADGETDTLNTLFEDTELSLDAEDVHRAALVCGESFVFAWKDEAGEVEAYYNDPRLCHVFYDEENPRKKSLAAKWWVGSDEKRYLTLYYPDHLEYYVSTGKAADVSSASAFKPTDVPDAENPFGAIPVFHFRPVRRKVKSELTNVLAPQNAINKLFADMMVAAEYGAFSQRWVISNADTAALKNAPNEIWNVPAGDGTGQQSSVGQFAATDLGNYLSAMDKIATALAIISRTPKHYFFAQGGDPSGEALIAMEAPLNKKCDDYINMFTPVWKELGAFLLMLSGQVNAQRGDVTPVFEQPETVQPRTQAEIREINVRAGIPIVNTLRHEGWTPEELDQLEEDKQDEKDAENTALANALLNAQRQMNQPPANPTPNGNGAPTQSPPPVPVQEAA